MTGASCLMKSRSALHDKDVAVYTGMLDPCCHRCHVRLLCNSRTALGLLELNFKALLAFQAWLKNDAQASDRRFHLTLTLAQDDQ